MAEEDNVIYVGKKPSMAYVLAAITQFNEGMNSVRIKARGKSISKAVDVAEIVKNKFLNDVKVQSVEIGTDEVTNQNGDKLNVSTIDIVLSK